MEGNWHRGILEETIGIRSMLYLGAKMENEEKNERFNNLVTPAI